MPGAEPVLSNYVPVIDHPVFFAGLVMVLALSPSSYTPRYRQRLARQVYLGTAPNLAPQKRGFDEFVGFPGGAALRWPFLVLAMAWYSMRDRLGV